MLHFACARVGEEERVLAVARVLLNVLGERCEAVDAFCLSLAKSSQSRHRSIPIEPSCPPARPLPTSLDTEIDRRLHSATLLVPLYSVWFWSV